MAEFFPFIGDPSDYELVDNELPLFKEIKYDFKTNNYVIDEKTNDFKVVEGNEAIEMWVYFALLTNRYEHLIFSWDYGTELVKLIGQKFTRGYTESEAFRFVKEALMINPYIVDVINREIKFSENELKIKIKVVSVYGEVDIVV